LNSRRQILDINSLLLMLHHLRKTTLLYLISGEQILIAMKKRGFGVGKWNGIGGKQDHMEEIEQTAVRECFEEINVRVGIDALKKHGIISFFYEGNPGWDNECHIYTTTQWEGIPSETEEMLPKWFHYSKIPYHDMWEDDKIWIPDLIEGKQVNFQFFFKKENLISYINLNNNTTIRVKD